MSTNNDKDMQAEREANLPKLTELMKLDLTDMHTKLVERMDYWMCEALKARAALTAAPVAADPDRWHSLTCDGTCSPPCKDATPPQQEGQQGEPFGYVVLCDWRNDVWALFKGGTKEEADRMRQTYKTTHMVYLAAPASTPAAASGEALTDEQYMDILRPVLSRLGMQRYLNGDSIELDPSDYRTIIERAILATRPTDASVRDAALEEAAKVCEARRPISRDECPEHWKAYEKSWGMRELVANECAVHVRALKSDAKGGA